MNSISVCMIVKDEELTLNDLLKSVCKFADEIVIVDTGSTDKSKDIAKNYTNLIFDYVWNDDFAAARNFSFSKATMDYIMWLDADDLILDVDIQKILDFKMGKKSDVDVYMLKYITGFDKNFNPTFSFFRERLLKREAHFVWQGRVHEAIMPRGKIEYLDINIYHNKQKKPEIDRNLRIYREIIASGQSLSARQQFYYSRELMFNKLYDEATLGFIKFLEEKKGWVEDNFEACIDLAYCYKQKGELDNALETLYSSFKFGKPRAIALYEIGNVFFQMGKFNDAIYWYKLARSTKDDDLNGFKRELDGNFYPCLQLCVCYFKLGNIKKAKHYNDLAKKLRPEDEIVLKNDNFFKNLMKKQ